MLSKMQKTWLWIFGGMFVVPEVLFWFTPLSILSIMSNFSEIDIKPIAYYFTNPQLFSDHPIYLLTFLIIEWVGILGLLVMSIQSKKKVFVILSGILLLWLSIIIFIGYVIANISIGI